MSISTTTSGATRLGEGGVAADVGEEHRHAAPLAAAGDAGGVGGARPRVTVPRETNFISSSRSLSWRIIAFIRRREVAELVAGAHALDPGREVAGADPRGDLADLQDRAGQAAGEEERRRGGDAEADEADQQAGCAACG